MAEKRLEGIMKSKTTTSLFEEMLAGYENMPREEAKSLEDSAQQEKYAENAKERNAIKDMRRLLVLLEKRIIGNQDEKDKQEIHENAKQWMESIAVLREYIELSEAKQ